MTILDTTPDFRAAILSNPDDKDARAVYADYLEERGDPLAAGIRLIDDMTPKGIVRQCSSTCHVFGPDDTGKCSNCGSDYYAIEDSNCPDNPANWDAARAWMTLVGGETLGKAWLLAWGRKTSEDYGFWFYYGREIKSGKDSDDLPVELKPDFVDNWLKTDTKDEAITAAAIAAGEAFRTNQYVCLWPDRAKDCFEQPRKCPECGKLAEKECKPCGMVYGSRGWRQLGVYDG